MEKELVVILTDFRISSARIFRLLYDGFTASARKLDRQRDENVFRYLQGRYVRELEKQLQQVVDRLAAGYHGQLHINTVRKELCRQVDYSLSEFLVKIRSM